MYVCIMDDSEGKSKGDVEGTDRVVVFLDVYRQYENRLATGLG